MNKKGCSLIEIIICISLIIAVGLGSIFTINIVANKKLITKLNEITDRAINAAQVYIETNEEANNQLYNNKNGVSLPLQLLVKEGLLNIDNTDLTSDDIKDQYVVTFLGSTNSNDNCEQVTSTTSWGNDKEIYLCLNSNGNSNLSMIDPNSLSNLNKVKRERYYFRGAEGGITNYVKYGDKKYQIYYVDTDDTLVLYSMTSFDNTFNGKTLPITSYKNYQVYFPTCKEDNTFLIYGTPEKRENYVDVTQEEIDGAVAINNFDIFQTSFCSTSIYPNDSNSYSSVYGNDFYSWMYYFQDNDFRKIKAAKGYKIHLNNKFKITSGTGDYANPYILKYN